MYAPPAHAACMSQLRKSSLTPSHNLPCLFNDLRAGCLYPRTPECKVTVPLASLRFRNTAR